MKQLISLTLFQLLLSTIEAHENITRQWFAHTGGVNGLVITDDYIYSGGSNGLASIWHRSNNSLVVTMTGHTMQISSLLVSHEYIFSGSTDKTIRQYWLNGTLIRVLSGHGGPVNGISCGNGTLLSSSADLTVRSWNITNGVYTRDYTGIHSGSILDVVIYGSTFFTGSADATIKQINIATGAILRTLSHSAVVRKLLLIRNILYSSSWDMTVKEWNADTGANTRTFKFYQRISESVVKEDALFSTGNLGSSFQMNMTQNRITRELTGHTGPVWRLVSDGRILLSGGSDGFIIEWNVTLPDSQSTPAPPTSTSSAQIGIMLATSSFQSSESTVASRGTLDLKFATLKLNSTSTRSENDVANDKRPVKQNSMATSFLALIITSAAFCVLIACGSAIFCLRCSNTRNFKNDTRMVLTEQTSVVAADMSSVITSTAIVTVHEMSIPGHLEKRFGDDFEPVDFVARGGGGDVFTCQASDSDLIQRAGGQQLVVKNLKQSFAIMGSRMKKAFYQELTLMWRFRDQPYFARVYAFSHDPACLVMKYYELGDMSAFIKGRSLAVQQFRYCKIMSFYLLRLLCTALNIMHKHGFAHCDMKPGNVLLEVNEYGWLSPVISDFGLTRILEVDNLQVKAFEVSDLKGASIAYAAPEVLFRFRNQVNNSPSVVKSGDVYAVSIIILEMMKRRNVW